MNGQNTKRVFVGIDPGLSGGIAVIDEHLNVLNLEDTPTIKASGKTIYDVAGMAAVLRRLSLIFGLWCGILGALELSFRTASPSAWTREVLKGCPGEGKARSIGFVTRMFPGAELVPSGCRRPRDGRTDALCLAYWGLKS